MVILWFSMKILVESYVFSDQASPSDPCFTRALVISLSRFSIFQPILLHSSVFDLWSDHCEPESDAVLLLGTEVVILYMLWLLLRIPRSVGYADLAFVRSTAHLGMLDLAQSNASLLHLARASASLRESQQPNTYSKLWIRMCAPLPLVLYSTLLIEDPP